MSAFHNLMFPVIKRTCRYGIVDQRLTDYAINRYFQNYLEHCLPGQQIWNIYNLQLYRWFISGTKILILENPLMHLDIPAQEKLFTVLNTFIEAGMTILILANEQGEYQSFCDKSTLLEYSHV
jgi:ABC-type sugar transport system ATPase subunit